MTFLPYSPITTTLQHTCKYLKSTTFLGCYLRRRFCKYGFIFFLRYENENIKKQEVPWRWLVLHEHKIINFWSFWEKYQEFFFKTNGLLSSAVQKLREITKLPRHRLDQRKPNYIGFSMKNQINGSPVSVNSFMVIFRRKLKEERWLLRSNKKL